MAERAAARAVAWLWGWAGAVSVQVKVLGIVLGVIVLLGGFVIVQIRAVLGDALTRDLQAQGVALAAGLASEIDAALAAGDGAPLSPLLADQRAHFSTEGHNTRIAWLVVERAGGAIMAAAGDPLPTTPGDPAPPLPGDNHRIVHYPDRGATEISQPLAEGGRLRLGLSRVLIAGTVDQVSIQLLSTTLVMVAVGFGAAFFLTWVLTRPILDLVRATHAVARGDFSQRVPRWAADEIGELAVAFNQMTEALAAADRERLDRDRLREHYMSGVISAQENERQRIARELHDSIGQSLTALLVGLGRLKNGEADSDTRAQADALRAIVAAALDEIRELSWRLRPRALDDLGLASALQQYVDDYQRRYGLPVEMLVSGLERRLPPELETTVYRIIQEGLTNIARYAGAAHVSLIVRAGAGRLKLIIEDDGVGFDAEAVGQKREALGLHGIRERAALFGGALTIESSPGQGASLFIDLPYPAQEEASP